MTKDLSTLRGSIVALVTPFAEDGSIDFEALDRLVDFQLEGGTDALLVLGTTGESATMTHEEDDAVVERVVARVAGRVPVIAGSGSNSTQTMLEKSLRFQELGVDGLLVISPYYNKANEEGMYLHFKTVLDAVKVPCILYNVPGRTGCSISENVVARLASHPNALAIKEASGNISYSAKIARHCGPDFGMFSGNDDIVVPMMSLGARGVISVWANIMPRECHELCVAFDEGRIQDALDIQLKCLEVINSLFCEVNPIPVKGALEMMGFGKAVYRLPLAPMSESAAARVRAALKEVGVIE